MLSSIALQMRGWPVDGNVIAFGKSASQRMASKPWGQHGPKNNIGYTQWHEAAAKSGADGAEAMVTDGTQKMCPNTQKAFPKSQNQYRKRAKIGTSLAVGGVTTVARGL